MLNRPSLRLLLLLSLLGSVLAVAPAAGAQATGLFISEYVEGSSNNKAIEIYNGTGAPVDLSSYQVQLFNNGNAMANASLDLRGSLSAGDAYVIANGQAAPEVLAVADITSGVTSFNGDDAIVLNRSGIPIDSFGQVGNDPGTEWAGGGLDDTLRRRADVCQGDSDSADAFDASLEWDASAVNTFDGLGAHTADCDGTGGDDPEPDPDPEPEPETPAITRTSAIQGSGVASPLAGQTVTVQGIVVGDFQDGAAGTQGDLNGFFVQEEDADVDGDDATSEGIFVFNGSNPSVDVAMGDLVTVTGNVSEFEGATQISAFGDAIEIVSSDNPLPTPASPAMPFASAAAPEQFEGMLVTFAQPLYVAEHFNLDRFGEMVLTQQASGLVTPTQVTEPGSDEYEALSLFNLRSQITLDDGRTVQNPSPIPFVDQPSADGSYTDNRRRGDSITELTGVLGQGFGRYRIQVDTDELTSEDFETTIDRPTAPPAVGGDMTVASFNVLNYFRDIGRVCGPSRDQDCRGASNPAELERQTAKTVTAIASLDADVIGLIEIQNDGDDAAAAALVAGLNDRMGEGTYDYVPTGFIGTDAITQAFIYRPAAVTPVGEEAVLDTPAFVNGLSSSPKSRPALAQTFADADGALVTVVVNHLKSKGSGCGADDDATDGSGNCDGTRTASARALVEWLATDPTGSGTEDQLVIGDLNAYAMEDPIEVFLEAGFVNTVLEEDPDAYGYVFDGQQGTLDYALASPSLAEEVTGAAEHGINADEADLIDYNLDFGRDPGYFSGLIPFRAADHDPVLVGLSLDADPGGPYEVRVGDQVRLDATGSDEGLSFTWDLDGDGLTDAEGPTPIYDARGMAPGRRPLRLVTTDAEGFTTTALTTIDVLAGGNGNDGQPPGRYGRR